MTVLSGPKITPSVNYKGDIFGFRNEYSKDVKLAIATVFRHNIPVKKNAENVLNLANM